MPVIRLLAENDRRVSNQDAFACYQRLTEHGIDAELYVNAPSPVYPERFWRVPGVDSGGSTAAHESLLAAGLLDRLDHQLLSPFESAWRRAIAAAGTVPLADTGAQLDVSHAEHSFLSDSNDRTLRFFDRQRGATPEPSTTPGVATSTPTPSATTGTVTPTSVAAGNVTPTSGATGTVSRPTPTPTGTSAPAPGRALMPIALNVARPSATAPTGSGGSSSPMVGEAGA